MLTAHFGAFFEILYMKPSHVDILKKGAGGQRRKVGHVGIIQA